MANWQDLSIVDILEKIQNEEIVLPVIQRELVWEEDDIELLFDTVLRGNSFGAIMTLKDLIGKKPLFEYRPFIKDYVNGKFIFATKTDKLPKKISYVIDGQQRLSAFYIGLTGSYNGRELYFDLLSEWEKEEFYLNFASNPDKLKKRVDAYNGNGKRRTFWYKVKDLFFQLKRTGGEDKFVVIQILDQYKELNFTDKEIDKIKENVANFNKQFLNSKNLGICEVWINSIKDIYWNRRKAVELFRRLNQGGTKLNAIDLMASILKSFSAENERFLYEDIKEFLDIGLSQDEVIKYIFLLQDNHRKELTDIEKSDSDFIRKNKSRILNSLRGVKQFLKASKLYDFFAEHRPSVIPLYFIGYHLFHKKSVSTEDIKDYFRNVEKNEDYTLIHRWIYLSLLQKIFRRRGAGWIAYKTGIRKILEVMKEYKNEKFPIGEIFKVYIEHPLYFKENIYEERLDDYDRDFLMYIIYGKKFRKEDLDHIHPYSILEDKGFSPEEINTVVNLQLLDYGLNRGDKNNKKLKDWIEDLPDKKNYLKRHLIPDNPELWSSDNYKEFIKERKKLIKEKLIEFIPFSKTFIYKSEDSRLFQELSDGFKKEIHDTLNEMEYKDFYQIYTDTDDIHFEWLFNGKHKFGVELHFEFDDGSINKKLLKEMEKFKGEIEKATGEKVLYKEKWYEDWTRICIEKEGWKTIDELKQWAIEKMIKFYNVLAPKIRDLKNNPNFKNII